VTDASINANVFLSFDNDTPGTVGIAWVGTVCNDPTYKTSINQYFVSDSKTAEVFCKSINFIRIGTLNFEKCRAYL
jgi:hypothetical protein